MADVQDILPLSPLQEGLLFHSLYTPGSGVYVEQRWCVVEGGLEPQAFRSAWNQVVNRHQALRAEFHWEETDEPVQVIYDEVEPEWCLALEGSFDDFLARDRERGFELDQGPLIRFALFPLEGGRYRFVWTFHHLLMDGWGNGVLIREVFASYEAEKNGTVLHLPESVPYRRFLDWHEARPREEEEAYWRATLQGFSEPSLLSPASEKDGEGYQALDFAWSAELTETLEHFAREARLTVNTLVQGAWALLLAAHTGRKDLLFGATVSGRPPEVEGIEQAIGLFINTVPVRVSLEDADLVRDWLDELQVKQREREQHGYGRLLELQSYTEVPAGVPLFESLLVFENYPISMDEALSDPRSNLSWLEREGYERTNYPLTVVVIPGKTLRVSFRYDEKSFSKSFIERLFPQFMACLHGVMIERELSDISCLSRAEISQLHHWGEGEVRAPSEETALLRFQQCALAHPGKRALIVGDSAFDYGSLDERSGRLASFLKARHGVLRGTRVGIYLERRESLLVALLAIWKCGAAYVPLDRDFPVERLSFMAGDAQLTLLLHEERDEVAEIFPDVARLSLSDQLFRNEDVLAGVARVDDPAYLIYTSGSTGQPKGVVLTHGNLANFLRGMDSHARLARNEILLAVTTVSFDISLLELFWPLVNGATLVLAASQAGRDGEVLQDLIATHDVTIMQATPITWRVLLESGGSLPDRVLCGGEALDHDLAERLVDGCAEVWNLYGPTETTIWSGALQLTKENLSSGTVPVGGPLLNTTFEVRGGDGRLVPQGVIGELWIGGTGVSPGYWKREELTARQFQNGWYASGDLMAWREDGLLEFKGRRDGQVKLRGFRIEVGDIESALTHHESVEEAVVVLQDQGKQQLVAFVRCVEEVSEEELRAKVGGKLPVYMVPSRVVAVGEFPLTPNRKIDRNALRAWKVEAFQGEKGNHFQSPKEELVAGIWSEILGVEVDSREAHFFESGGHSLSATRVVSRVREVLGITVPLRILFEHPRVGEFVSAFETRDQEEVSAIPRWQGEGEKRPLSAAQRRQWLMAGLSSGDALYSVPSAVRITGALSSSRLTEAWQGVVNLHEGLRLIFEDDLAEPYGRVLENIVVGIEARELTEETWEVAAREIVGESFDLSCGPLWRVFLFKLSAEEHILFFNFHHILVDGWSLGLLVKDLAAAYQGALLGQESGLRYVDHAVWQNARDWDEGLEFWRENLRGLPPELPLPLDFSRPAEIANAGRTYEFEIDARARDGLVKLGQQEGTTLFMTLATAFVVLLHRYGGGTDIAFGTPVANRLREEIESTLGLFVNTLVLRSRLDGNPTLAELLAGMRAQTLAAYQHQEVPFEEVVEALEVPRSRALSPLFQVLLTLQNAPLERTKVEGLEWAPVPVETGMAKFDLSLAMRETPEGLVGRLEYRSDLFLPETIEQMAGDFVRLLERLPEMLELPLSALTVLDRRSEEALLILGSGGQAGREATIPECFAAQMEDHAIALKQGDRSLTYRELDDLSEKYAAEFRLRGVGLETRVGVMAVRSPETVAAILAILKVGGTYVPLDTELPESRMLWMVEDAGVHLIFSDDPKLLEDCFAPSRCEKIEGQGHLIQLREGSSPAEFLLHENHVAYLLYTSGSTGVPKGVLTPHRGVVRLVRDNDSLVFGPDEVFLQAAPLSFDASTLEIWGALLNGGRLVLAGRDTPPLGELAELVQQEGISTMWLTAGLFHLAVDEEIQEFSEVKQLIAGGDVLSPAHLRRAGELWPETQLINGYGPTEATTFACCHRFGREELGRGERAPIGRPIGETDVYLLDDTMNLVPRGVVGNLYLGGRGLARGYLGQASLTAEAFLPNPFFDPRKDSLTDEKMTLYRTGDRARWRRDGTLEFLGRDDEQVKIRGFRIEPSEVEKALLDHASVKDAVVVTRDKRLVAYVVGGHDNLRSYLAEILPPPFVPSQFVMLEKLPLTTNGKVDREALPEPDWDARKVRERAGTPQEEKVRAVWQTVLPAHEVGLHDNFFELGGDSILALQIISRLKRIGLDASPADLFQYQSVSALAAVVRTDGTAVPVTLSEVTEEAFIPPPIQAWFQELQLEKPHHFNQATGLRCSFSFDHEALDQALRAVVQHHDALRLRWQDGLLALADSGKPRVRWVDDESFDEVVTELQQSLNLESGPLFQVVGSDGRGTRLAFIAHHSVIDAVSWHILLEDLHEGYRQLSRGEPMLFPAKTVSYQAWSGALGESLEVARSAKDYWRSVIAHALGLNEPDFTGVELGKLEFVSPGKVTSTGDFLSSLLAALGRAIAHETGRSDLAIMLESHGRNSEVLGLDLDLFRSVGWFTSIYPVVFRGLDEGSLEAVKTSVEETLDRIPHGGLSYGILRYLDGDDSLELTPTVGFNFLGQIDSGNGLVGFERVSVPGHPVAPENGLPYAVVINCWLEGGELRGEWNFRKGALGVANPRGMVDRFLKCLGEFDQETSADFMGMDKSQLALIAGQIDFGGGDDE